MKHLARRERTDVTTLDELRALMASLPEQEDEPGAVAELLAEIAELAPARARATAHLLGDES